MGRGPLLAIPIVAVFMAMLGAACVDGEAVSPRVITPIPAATSAPTPTTRDEIDSVFAQLGPVLQAELRRPIHDWVRAESDEGVTLDLLNSVREAQGRCCPAFAQDELASLFASIHEWANDGVDIPEKRFMQSWFETYGLLAPVMPGITEGPLIRTAIWFRVYEFVELPESGKTGLIVVGGSRATWAQNLAQAKAAMTAVDAYLGRQGPHAVSIVVGQSPNCLTPAVPPVILLTPDCADSFSAVARQVAHIYLGLEAPTWFAEGAAAYTAAVLSGTLAEEVDARRAMSGVSLRPQVQLEGRPRPGTRGFLEEEASGFVLLADLAELLGPEAMQAGLRAAKGQRSGAEVVSAISAASPPEEREAVARLIAARVIP
jgi:hypothetical protein